MVMLEVPAALINSSDLQRLVAKSCSEVADKLVPVIIKQLLMSISSLSISTDLHWLNKSTGNNNASSSSSIKQPANQTMLSQIALQKAIAMLLNNQNNSQTIASFFDNLNKDSKSEILEHNANSAFLLTMAIFIFSMGSGFAMLEVGMVRSKNVANSLWKNISFSFVSAIGYWLVGMALAFGQTEDRFAGKTFWAFRDIPVVAEQGPDLMFFFFEFVFCTTAGAIMSAPIAERAQIACYLLYTLWASAITYPIVVHWCWSSEGWLKYGAAYSINGQNIRIGFEDFAGSGVVHACGGAAAFVALIFVGPRIGRFGPNGEVNVIRGHSLPLVCTGAMSLYTGFFAFNAGSQLSISKASDTASINRAAVNTLLSGTGGLIFVGIISRVIRKRWLVIPTLCGGLAGCVAACCSCNTVEGWGALCIGMFSGLCFLSISHTLEWLRIDDAADAVGVHCGGGFAGCIGLAFFKINVGIFYNWDMQSGLVLGWQLLGFLTICLWSASHTYVIFYILKMFNMVRVDPETELLGLDYAHGHEVAYPYEAYSAPNNRSSVHEEIDSEKLYELVFDHEMSKYTIDYIYRPGWSHKTIGGVWFDLSWISVVRSHRHETRKLSTISFNSSNITEHDGLYAIVKQRRRSKQSAATFDSFDHKINQYNGLKTVDQAIPSNSASTGTLMTAV